MERQGRSLLLSYKPWPSLPPAPSSSSPQICSHFEGIETLPTTERHLSGVPFTFKQPCQGFICQSDVYAKLTREFADYDTVHGAVNVRILLWGNGGHGKREISTHFAKSQASSHKKTILWVEGHTPVTFVRDLRLAYQLMTGQIHPSGVSVRWQLFRISRALSQCKSKWLMVIFDLHPDLQSASLNETGIDLASYLPDGQILITYSPKMHLSNGLLNLTEVPLDFALRGIHRLEHIAVHDQRLVRLLIHQPQSPFEDATPCSEISLKKFSLHLLSAVLASSVARGSRISLDHYRQILNQRNLRLIGRRFQSSSRTNLLLTFASTMEMLLELLRSVDNAAELLLMALAAACSRDIPIRLLQKLRPFRDMIIELEDALELLQSMSVIHIRTLTNGDRFIDLHHMVHSWLTTKFKGSRSEKEPEFRRLIRSWVHVLDQDLPEIQNEADKQRYWLSLHLVLTVTRNAELVDLHCTSLVSLLRKIATFMSDFLVTPLEANRLLARALYLTASMNSDEPGFNLTVERFKLHCERSRLCALLGDYQQARQEIDYAQTCMNTLSGSGTTDALPYNLTDELIELSLRQGNHLQARLMISKVLFSCADMSAERKGKLHYWAVCCASGDRISLLRALQHSHRAMSFWQTLPEDERWGSKSFSMIAWVDAHTDLLLQMDRGRGALVFMPKLLDHYIEQCPPTTEAIWRVAYCLVCEYIGIKELEAAEQVACRVLALCEFNQLEGLSLAWALTMLHVLGAMFARTGRYVESEGIFGTCLNAIESRKPPRVSGQGQYSSPNLWLELCHTLLAQGKDRQAEAARSLALERGFDNLKADNWKDTALEPRRSLQRVFNRALQVARDRIDGIYNSEDYLLDAIWPKTFSIAIQVFGDPLEHIKNNTDGIDDVLIPTSETLGEFSTLLDLLGFHFDSSETNTSSQDGEDESLWRTVFESNLTVLDRRRQSRMWDYWRWCTCRRKRHRTSSVSYDTVLRNKTICGEEKRKQTLARTRANLRAQKVITDFFPWQKRYPAALCPLDCPCIKANSGNDTPISSIERERLYVYQSPNIMEQEARRAAYRHALRQYRYRFGPRPAVPYGMSFMTYWKKPTGPTEPNGRAKKQHEIVWEPDFVFSGDLETNWGFLGQDENYLFSNPAMTVQSNGVPWSLPDLPNIVITSYKLGEEVRGNKDLFNVRGRKQLFQTNIMDYLDNADDSDGTDTDATAASNSEILVGTQPLPPPPPPPPAPLLRTPDLHIIPPRRRRGRKGPRIPPPPSKPSSRSTSSARSRSASPTNNNQTDSRRSMRRLHAKDKLKLFSIDSVHSLGSAFEVSDFSEQSFRDLKKTLITPNDTGPQALTNPSTSNVPSVSVPMPGPMSVEPNQNEEI